ncbi:MAG TPA: NADH-quinone oxidoreductase subunit N [Gemmatimonadales bacterium]|nr:NADH-quinone oxidoreductase subunit N [Gemmatimonadales bacterium]
MTIDLSTAGGITVALLPEILLTAWALVLLLVIGWRHASPDAHRTAAWIALAGLVSALAAVVWLWQAAPRPEGFAVMLALDGFRWATAAIFLLGAIAAVLMAIGYLGRERMYVPEFYAMLLFATIGMLLMGGAADLIVVFLGLELMSISVYVMAALKRRSPTSAEAGLKYFLLGAFASGFLLYGIALIYGATGTTNLAGIALQIGGSSIAERPMLGLGVALLLVGFGFKVSAVPFHMWAPDVYDGAPTPATAYMAAAVKAAGFAALVRVAFTALGEAPAVWQTTLWWLATLTMIVGNLVALAQRRLKRMLAYSSIAHAGYLLVAATTGTEAGASAFVFYALAYTLVTVGAFAVLAAVGRDGESDVLIDDLDGLAARRPWVAFGMSVFMLSLLGFPGTAGFIGKWLILTAAVGADQGLLAVLLVITSVVSAGYYLPVVMAMYMKPAADPAVAEGTILPGGARAVVLAAAVALLLLGVWPNRVIDLARSSAADLTSPAGLLIGSLPR